MRGWSDEQANELFSGVPGTGGAAPAFSFEFLGVELRHAFCAVSEPFAHAANVILRLEVRLALPTAQRNELTDWLAARAASRSLVSSPPVRVAWKALTLVGV